MDLKLVRRLMAAARREENREVHPDLIWWLVVGEWGDAPPPQDGPPVDVQLIWVVVTYAKHSRHTPEEIWAALGTVDRGVLLSEAVMLSTWAPTVTDISTPQWGRASLKVGGGQTLERRIPPYTRGIVWDVSAEPRNSRDVSLPEATFSWLPPATIDGPREPNTEAHVYLKSYKAMVDHLATLGGPKTDPDKYSSKHLLMTSNVLDALLKRPGYPAVVPWRKPVESQMPRVVNLSCGSPGSPFQCDASNTWDARNRTGAWWLVEQVRFYDRGRCSNVQNVADVILRPFALQLAEVFKVEVRKQGAKPIIHALYVIPYLDPSRTDGGGFAMYLHFEAVKSGYGSQNARILVHYRYTLTADGIISISPERIAWYGEKRPNLTWLGVWLELTNFLLKAFLRIPTKVSGAPEEPSKADLVARDSRPLGPDLTEVARKWVAEDEDDPLLLVEELVANLWFLAPVAVEELAGAQQYQVLPRVQIDATADPPIEEKRPQRCDQPSECVAVDSVASDWKRVTEVLASFNQLGSVEAEGIKEKLGRAESWSCERENSCSGDHSTWCALRLSGRRLNVYPSNLEVVWVDTDERSAAEAQPVQALFLALKATESRRLTELCSDRGDGSVNALHATGWYDLTEIAPLEDDIGTVRFCSSSPSAPLLGPLAQAPARRPPALSPVPSGTVRRPPALSPVPSVAVRRPPPLSPVSSRS